MIPGDPDDRQPAQDSAEGCWQCARSMISMGKPEEGMNHDDLLPVIAGVVLCLLIVGGSPVLFLRLNNSQGLR